ncbi:MAG: hypothetical protein V4685_02215 [Bacteroidota bacterium]
MKRLLSIVLLLSGLQGFAQQKFIEVTVSDTVLIKPDCFMYRISLSRSDNALDTMAYTNPDTYKLLLLAKAVAQRTKLDSLKKQLKQKNFRCVPASIKEAYQFNTDYMYGGFNYYFVDVITNTTDSIKLLYNIVSENRDLSGAFIESFTLNKAPYEKRLYQKLLASAQTKAETLALLSKRKVGAVISITEGKEKESQGWTIYPPLSAIADSAAPGWHTTINEPNYTTNETVNNYVMVNSLVVKYALE